MSKSKKGNISAKFLVIFSFVFAVIFYAVTAVYHCNFWYVENDIRDEVKKEHKEILSVIKIEPGIFDKTILTVRVINGDEKKICLDTDIHYNYSFSNCKK